MGESNAGVNRRKWGNNPMRRETMLAAASAYHFAAAGFGKNTEGFIDDDLSSVNISATFEVIYMIGWAPHESQQRPNRRGTAVKSMKDISVTKTTAGGTKEPTSV
jgi:NADH dehydrogenase [ubiquinone] 1 alpha subcomplex assembly factor 5